MIKNLLHNWNQRISRMWSTIVKWSRNYTKLARSLTILLTLQMLMYTWAMFIVYTTSHDEVYGLDGLIALLPLGVFCLLGIVNAVLALLYIIKIKSQKMTPSVLIFSLACINILLFAEYYRIVDYFAYL